MTLNLIQEPMVYKAFAYSNLARMAAVIFMRILGVFVSTPRVGTHPR